MDPIMDPDPRPAPVSPARPGQPAQSGQPAQPTQPAPSIRPLQLLAISGSLRAVSSNSALLQATALLAPEGVEVTLYTGLGALPPFNPDLEEQMQRREERKGWGDADLPAGLPAVIDFRRQLAGADGVLISSPEYAHGVPGVLKNALDWVVGSGELIDKPVTLLNATPPATFAQASLSEALSVMSARLIPDASIAVALRGKRLDAAGIVADANLSGVLRAALLAFVAAIRGDGGADR